MTAPRRRSIGAAWTAGFTLVEVMMAIVVLSVGLVAASRVFSMGRLLDATDAGRLAALAACEHALENALVSHPDHIRDTSTALAASDMLSAGVVEVNVTDVEPGVRKVEATCRFVARAGVPAYERLATLVGDTE